MDSGGGSSRKPRYDTARGASDVDRKRNASFACKVPEEFEILDRRNREARIIIGPCEDGIQMLSDDLKSCPPWRVDGARSERRSVVDFLDQFWFQIGTYITDSAQCLMRFSMILDASEATQFMVKPIREYVARQRQLQEPCEFSFAEDRLRRAYWSYYHQKAIETKFRKTSYDSRNCNMIKFATFWYRRLQQIGKMGPKYKLKAVYLELPDEFRSWCKCQLGFKYPDTLEECCEWAAWYEVTFHAREALGGSVKIARATAALDVEYYETTSEEEEED